MTRTIAASAIKVGMICEDWDHAGKTVASSETVKRFDLSYELQVIKFTDNTQIIVTPARKINVRK